MLTINQVPVQSAPSISRDCDVHSATSPLTVVFYPVICKTLSTALVTKEFVLAFQHWQGTHSFMTL